MVVRETIRRLTAKNLLATVSGDMTRDLRPTQLASGTKNGCEAIVHAIRRWVCKHDNDEQRCLLTMDLENAFNQIDRSCFLQLARYSDLCCSDDTFVMFHAEKILKKAGSTRRPPKPTALCPRPRESHPRGNIAS